MGLTNKVSSPLPVRLPQECAKATKIFSSFVDPYKGMDKLIPNDVLRSARGFAIFTVVKAGFLFSARAGTGVVIARLDNGGWSAPSAIGTTGLGFGGQAGAEITDFIIVLNSKAAVKTFMSAGSLTLGGNMSVALGPLGRNAEGTGALNSKGKVAAMYSYSKTKGLFGGVSIEGSVIVERSDANAKAYRADVTAKQLLTGQVDVPAFAEPLIQAITSRAGTNFDSSAWIDDSPMNSPAMERNGSGEGRDRGYSFGSSSASLGSSVNTNTSTRARSGSLLSRPSFSPRFSFKNKSGSNSPRDSPKNGKPSNRDYFETEDYDSRSRNRDDYSDDDYRDRQQSFDLSDDDRLYKGNGDRSNYQRGRSGTLTNKKVVSYDDDDDYPIIQVRKDSKSDPFSDDKTTDGLPRQSMDSLASDISDFESPRTFQFNGLSMKQEKTDVARPGAVEDLRASARPALPKRQNTLPGSSRVIAMYDFVSSEPGDLPFSKNDVITVVKKPEGEEWWVGKLGGREGIFPSNYVQATV